MASLAVDLNSNGWSGWRLMKNEQSSSTMMLRQCGHEYSLYEAPP